MFGVSGWAEEPKGIKAVNVQPWLTIPEPLPLPLFFMSHSCIDSEPAEAAGLPAIPLIENVLHDVASSNASTNESRTWWFLPEHMSLPPQSRKLSRTSGAIPKPRNAYALFRSYLGHKVLPADVPFCARQATISRIASHIWWELPSCERNRFEKLFQEEQRLYQCLYPDYVMQDRSPSTIIHKPKAKDIEGDDDAIKCKKIADILLDNIEGEQLVAAIRKVVGVGAQPCWLKLAPAPSGSRCSSSRLEMNTTEAIVAAPAKKALCSRVKTQRVDAKYRSSSSKMHQGKAAMMRLPSPVPNPAQATTPCSGEIHLKTWADVWDFNPISPIHEIRPEDYDRFDRDIFDDHGWEIALEIISIWPGQIAHEKPFDTDHPFNPLEDAGHLNENDNNSDKEETIYLTTSDTGYPLLSERPPPLIPDFLGHIEDILMGPGRDYLVDDLVYSMEHQTISLP